MYRNRRPPGIYVSHVMDDDINAIPPDAVDLTRGTDGYIVNDTIEGLFRPDAEIDMVKKTGVDASRIGEGRTYERNIVFRIIPVPNTESARHRLYTLLPHNQMIRLYVVTDYRFVFIDGKVETLNGSIDAGKPYSLQLSVRCPDPWFKSVELHSLALSAGEYTIGNAGDIPAGFIWKVWNGTVGELNGSDSTVPTYTTYKDMSITIGEERFAYTGTLTTPYICTITGQRKFKIGGGGLATMGTTAFGHLTADSGWPVILPGDNTMIVDYSSTSDDGTHNLFYWRDTYSGV